MLRYKSAMFCCKLSVFCFRCFLRAQTRTARTCAHACRCGRTVNLRAKILDFRGFDSSNILILRGGILMSIGNLPEVLSQRILVWIILVGRLGVRSHRHAVSFSTKDFKLFGPSPGQIHSLKQKHAINKHTMIQTNKQNVN